MTDLSALPRPRSRQSMPETAQKVFQGSVFSVYQWEQELYDGSRMVFEKLARQDSVGVIAVTEDNKILLSEQEQPSLLPFRSVLGGVVDTGEQPFETAQRELLEEAGATAQKWQLWYSSQPSSKIDWANYIFIAQGCRVVQAPSLDGGEKITVLPVTFDRFVKIVFEPDFRDQDIAIRVARVMAAGELAKLRQLLLGE